MSFCVMSSFSPACDAELPLDEVLAGDHLRDRVLDLDPRVDLHEVEVEVLVQHELDGARGVIADFLGQPNGGGADLVAHLGGQVRSGAFLDELLPASLDGAFALEQVHDVAAHVAEELHLDVAEVLDALFHVEPAVAEGDLGLALGLLEARSQGGLVVGEADAASPAAGGGLDGDGIADLRGDPDGLVRRRRSRRRCRAWWARWRPWRVPWPGSCRPGSSCSRRSGR